MRIEYTCADGSRTLAKWASMALLHWLGRSQPTRPIENPEPFKLYVVSQLRTLKRHNKVMQQIVLRAMDDKLGRITA
jgi:hypothetical protein